MSQPKLGGPTTRPAARCPEVTTTAPSRRPLGAMRPSRWPTCLRGWPSGRSVSQSLRTIKNCLWPPERPTSSARTVQDMVPGKRFRMTIVPSPLVAHFLPNSGKCWSSEGRRLSSPGPVWPKASPTWPIPSHICSKLTKVRPNLAECLPIHRVPRVEGLDQKGASRRSGGQICRRGGHLWRSSPVVNSRGRPLPSTLWVRKGKPVRNCASRNP